MKKTYCDNPSCQEKCLTKFASVGCVAIGSLLVGVIAAIRFLGGLKYIQSSEITIELLWMPVAMILVFMLITIFFSLFERFDHWFVAMLFGASTPSLLFGLASLSVPD